MAIRTERIDAAVQVDVALRVSARCREKVAVDGQESSTRLVAGKVWIANLGNVSTVNGPAVVKLPCGVSMVMGPVMASAGTTVVNCRSVRAAFVLKTKTAGTPLKSTRVAPVKLVPLNVII